MSKETTVFLDPLPGHFLKATYFLSRHLLSISGGLKSHSMRGRAIVRIGPCQVHLFLTGLLSQLEGFTSAPSHLDSFQAFSNLCQLNSLLRLASGKTNWRFKWTATIMASKNLSKCSLLPAERPGVRLFSRAEQNFVTL